MGEQPIRFELSTHPDFGYRVSIPELLSGDGATYTTQAGFDRRGAPPVMAGAAFRHGGRLAVREDRATPADVEAVAKHLAARDLGIAKPDAIENICEGYLDEARCLLAAVFPDSKAGA